ncbi:uncharacterized protein LOC133711720 [Rosa rugosa]|uniref:uncharacterized protein LOC133711720 n=1 Tax=Rosa rugosa TaxID=74645 RepID=UPI002B40D178|nr:uncharacterized protein LOC133711720 [Rosa rugosa]
MKRLWAKIRQSQDEDDEEMMANNVIVIIAVVESANQIRGLGSQLARALNEERFREERGKNMMEDYFVEHPVFKEWEIRTRYRMSHNIFNRIVGEICRYDRYFVQKLDVIKKVRLLPKQKMTCSLRMLTYAIYLRAPTAIDLIRLLAKAKRRAFPGKIGSIDYMHWQWKNCPTAWAGEYSG